MMGFEPITRLRGNGFTIRKDKCTKYTDKKGRPNNERSAAPDFLRLRNRRRCPSRTFAALRWSLVLPGEPAVGFELTIARSRVSRWKHGRWNWGRSEAILFSCQARV